MTSDIFLCRSTGCWCVTFSCEYLSNMAMSQDQSNPIRMSLEIWPQVWLATTGKPLPMNLPLTLTYPPIEMPVIPRGQYPSLSSQRRSAVDSRMRAPPITNRSDTFFRLDRLKRPHKTAAKWIWWAPKIPTPWRIDPQLHQNHEARWLKKVKHRTWGWVLTLSDC